MKNGVEDFVVESTPVLDLKKNGLNVVSPVSSGENWDSDRTEVYTDSDSDNAVASLIGENGESYPITTFPYVMGRGSECDLVLQGKGISRRHAEIIFQSGRFVVNDLESLNGLKVNGYKVSRVILEENDTIKLGEVGLIFQSSNAAAGATTPTEPKKSKSKFSLFESSARPDQVPTDNTFGGSPVKKIAINGIILLIAGTMGWFGYNYWLANASRISEVSGVIPGNVASTANQPPAARTPATPASADVSPQVARQEVAPASASVAESSSTTAPQAAASIDPPPSIAPPPSLANTVQKKPETQPQKVVDVPVASTARVQPRNVEAAKPQTAKKPVVNNTDMASQALTSSEKKYLQGDAPGAMELLKPFLSDNSVAPNARAEVKRHYSNIAGLNQLYLAGQSAYAAGQKETAFNSWTQFMQKESEIFSGRKSAYTQGISSKVVNEYVALANDAAKAGDNHKAYRLWQKSLEIGDNVAARIAIDNANNKAMQLYRQALRLEYVNTNKAKALWQEVVNLLPPGTEYNTKAGAKLAWYEKWGS